MIQPPKRILEPHVENRNLVFRGATSIETFENTDSQSYHAKNRDEPARQQDKTMRSRKTATHAELPEPLTPAATGLLRTCLLGLAAEERGDVEIVGRHFRQHVGDVARDLLHHVGLRRSNWRFASGLPGLRQIGRLGVRLLAGDFAESRGNDSNL